LLPRRPSGARPFDRLYNVSVLARTMSCREAPLGRLRFIDIDMNKKRESTKNLMSSVPSL